MFTFLLGDIANTKNDRNLMDTNEICDSYAGPGMEEEKIVLSCKPSAIEGRFVTIQKLDKSVLTVGEIEVFGKELSFDGTKKGLKVFYHYE